MLHIGKRLKELREKAGLKQPELAELCGWGSQSRISQYENDKREPSLSDLEAIAQALRVSVKEILFGEEESPTATGLIVSYEATDELDAEDYIFVERHDLRLSAGCGNLAWVVHEKDPLAFRRRFLNARRLDPKSLKALYVRGDSMQPYLADGDTVMIDTGDTAPKDGEVYAVCFDDEWFIKRIFKQPGGTLILHSDNERYRDIEISAEQAEFIRIFGHVVWRGG
ncbi:LexA family transcriptional regulator [Chromobacterium sp. S0633]|uniref:XRE family transcriptional regulator n=1 Tax=Chromobacterium sp. S0633 TaxID=2957805 RepID=UPI0020A15096|nr:LexA family transcriptional regulator [Chromobacterium sp. S0633]